MVDLLLVFVVVLLGVLVVSVLSSISTNIEEIKEEPKKECKLHNWVTDEKTEKLVCCECGKFAGMIETDND
jgi:hypothetical protein